MKPLSEARRKVVEAMTVLEASLAPLAAASGLCLAEDVVVSHDLPPFPNSAMDGFAVIAADTARAPVTLEVVEDVPAGSVPTVAVVPGTATRIMTGAPLPAGADSVVMVERTEYRDGVVEVSESVERGAHVRPSGSDLTAGSIALAAGERLAPAHLGLLSAIGAASPLVVRRPVVAVVSTGDEILPGSTADLPPGKIRDANGPMLIALLTELGVEVKDLGIVGDDARLLRSTLEEAAGSADAVVTSGGVSMGEHDLVKQVLADLGHVEFWRVAMQPAKPFAFGFLGDTPLFGLPGNPVSVVVAFEQFVRPALLKRMGATRLLRPRISSILGEGVSTDPEKTVFLRMRLDGDRAVRAGGQGSHVLSALAGADAFGVVPVGVSDLKEGDRIVLELFRSAETRRLDEAPEE